MMEHLPLPPLSSEVGRVIGALRDSKARLTLMSVAAETASVNATIDAVRRAANASDRVGVLADGTVGILSLACRDSDGESCVEERFLDRFKGLPAPRCPAHGEIIAFRAVHRWAMELADDSDLIDALFGAPCRYVAIERRTLKRA